MPRLLEPFASRDLISASFSAEIVDDHIHVVVRHTTMDDRLEDIIAEKMRAGVPVERVEVAQIAKREASLPLRRRPR